MQTRRSTTPFGRRPLTLAMVASQSEAKKCADGRAVHKWEAFHAVCEGRAALGVSERALAVLDALLSFHPETVLTSGADLVVFPSNANLALRAHGMPASTLRRHLAVLVEAGLVIRRDSPNGKRYLRKGGTGEGDRAFGFDLTPIVARADEFQEKAEAVRRERAAVARWRERITVARRDIRKACEAGEREGCPGDWLSIRKAYGRLLADAPRLAPSMVLAEVGAGFEALAEEAFKLLTDFELSSNPNASESQIERHHQNSNTEPVVLEPSFDEDGAEGSGPSGPVARPASPSLPLPMILEACPDIVDYNRRGISDWRDLEDAAGVARAALGISPSAYEDARAVLGRGTAAAVVAAILQKGSAVNSPGAYLRGLTEKARAGGFSITPMVMALLGAKRRASPPPSPESVPIAARLVKDRSRGQLGAAIG